MDHEYFMKQAINKAGQALATGDVPIGAVVVRDGEIIAAACNEKERCGDALRHAELLALERAAAAIGDWRLSDCTLYVTLEPCPMCAGAIINARVGALVYGAADEKAGACGSVCNLFAMPLNHAPAVTRGVRERECAELLERFFETLR
ncbi:nucleoside deaminase [Clostridiales bacterium BX7]|uniref:tRNA-specific adenosine deaminase n=2 Tax=Feifania hominis TaxID=2763660 RepID=A0A926HUU5_9FIRM|nr:nucleoside deaminase [Feifania hominis]